MFSSRFVWDLAPNRLAAALAAKRGRGEPILDLTESNPTRAGFRYTEAIVEALANPAGLVYEPHPLGAPSVREAIATSYAERGIAADPERIVLTASSSESYSWLFKLLCDPGDEVLVPRPSYPLFDFLAGLEQVRIRSYPLCYEGAWRIDTEALAWQLSTRTRAIVLVHPNNPTGSFAKRDEAAALEELAERHGLALIADEVFADYGFEADPQRVGSFCEAPRALSFALGGLSKAAGLPQMKLGWIVLGGPEPLRTQALERLELIADTYLSVGTPVQAAAPALLALGRQVREQILARTRANLATLAARLAKPGPLRLFHVEGGWYATIEAPGAHIDEDWCVRLLESAGLLVHPGSFYGFRRNENLVVSLLPSPEDLEKGLDALLTAVDGGVS